MKKTFFTLLMAVCAITGVQAANYQYECGKNVEVTITPITGYHFVQWTDGNTDNPRIIMMDQDSSLHAVIAINQYQIVFNNWNDTALQSETLNHGEAISFKGITPTKPATAQYSYAFSGWSPNIPNPAVATSDMTFTAQFEAIVNKYVITFVNYNGDTLQSSEWEYGAKPIYSGATPTKPADAQYTYSFTGWDKMISNVTGEITYTAQYTNATNSYTITTTGENGTTTGGGTYQYGTEVTITATPNECYEFVKWSDGDTNATRQISVTGTTTYTAEFRKTIYTLSVDVNDAEHATIGVKEVTE